MGTGREGCGGAGGGGGAAGGGGCRAGQQKPAETQGCTRNYPVPFLRTIFFGVISQLRSRDHPAWPRGDSGVTPSTGRERGSVPALGQTQ